MHPMPARLRDDRIERALTDPDTYFREARERARAQVVAEIAAERTHRRHAARIRPLRWLTQRIQAR
jgi:hypothetical protein